MGTLRGRATSSYGSPSPIVSHTRNFGRCAPPYGAAVSSTVSMKASMNAIGARVASSRWSRGRIPASSVILTASRYVRAAWTRPPGLNLWNV